MKQAKAHVDKHEIFGHRVDFKGGKKLIDQTTSYSKAIEVTEQVIKNPSFGTIGPDTVQGILFFE